ncbi:ABC transporter permease [Cellulomonas hominis]
MRPAKLLRESWNIARTSRGASAVVVLATALTCVLALLTAGRAAATEQAVIDSIADAGSRLIVMSSTTPDGGPEAAVVDRASELAGVDWALGVGRATDVRNGAVPGGAMVASRTLMGSPPAELHLVAGRWPAEGEAVVSARSAGALGLDVGAGQLVTSDNTGRWDVVGVFRPEGALADLDHVVLTGRAQNDRVGSLYVLAYRPQDVPGLARVVRTLAAMEDPDAITVQTSRQLVELTDVVSGHLGAASRQFATGAMGAGLLFVAVTLYSSIGARRRDFGRRRALGASRSALVVLVVGQAFWPALGGVLLGTAAGLVTLGLSSGAMPAGAFTASVGVLVLVASVVAAVPAALGAALHDPVRILRVP